MDGNDIDYSSEVKYLGVILDSRLMFRQNIMKKNKKGNKAYEFA